MLIKSQIFSQTTRVFLFRQFTLNYSLKTTMIKNVQMNNKRKKTIYINTQRGECCEVDASASIKEEERGKAVAIIPCKGECPVGAAPVAHW